MSMFITAVRLMFSESTKSRNKNLKTPDSVYSYNDLLYGEDPIYQSLDIYTPEDSKDKKLPTIISVHGGGFVYGKKEDYQYYCMDLARRGFKVINFSYRLAPEYKFPTQLEDTNTVFNWVVENADKYHLDLDNLFAVGDSAGGNILGLYAGFLTNPKALKETGLSLDLPDLKLKAIALNCGLYNPKRQNPLKDGSLTHNLMKELFFNKNRDESKIIVENYITKNYPSTFIVTSENDFLRDQPEYILKNLTQKKVPFNYAYFASKDKILGHVFHLDINSPEAKSCNDRECAFFKEIIETTI